MQTYAASKDLYRTSSVHDEGCVSQVDVVRIAELNPTTVREPEFSGGPDSPLNPQPTFVATPAIPAPRAMLPASCLSRQGTS